VRPLACNWYYCAQFIAKPKAACALRFSWAATSINLGLRANMTSSIKPEVHNLSLRRQRDRATATGNMLKKFGEDRTCSFDDMIADRQTYTHTHTQRHAHHNTPLPCRGRGNNSPHPIGVPRITMRSRNVSLADSQWNYK